MHETLDLIARLIPAGVLGVIWFDIRKVRGEVESKYLSSDKHTDLCEIAALTTHQTFTEALVETKKEILTEIKNNNKK